MPTIPYRPARGLGVSLLGDAQLEDRELQDADLTQPGVTLRGPGSTELPARVHQTGGGETALDPEGAQALFFRPDVQGDELCMVHNDTLYGSRPTEVTVNGTQAWRRVGTWAPWTLREVMLHQPLFFVFDCDVATIRDAVTGKLYHVVVWEQGNVGAAGKAAAPGVYAIAVDESGAVVAPATLLAAGVGMLNPRACACDTGVVIVWHDTAIATWRASAWRLNNPVEFVAAVNLVAGSAGTAPLHDMRKDGVNDRVILVLADSVAAFSLPLRLVTVSLVVTSLGAVGVAQAPSVGVAVDVDPLGGYLLSWADATTANAVHVDNAGIVDTVIATVVTSNPPVRITGCHVNGVASRGTLAVEQRVGAAPDFRDHVQTYSYNGAALTSVRTQRGAAIWGHALVYRGRAVAWTEHYVNDGLQQGVQVLVDLLTGDVLARAFLDTLPTGTAATARVAQYTQPCTPQIVGDALYQAAGTHTRTVFSLTNVLPDSIGVSRVDGAVSPRKPATVPGYAFDALAGAMWGYSGLEATEADWHVLPSITTATAGGGGSMTSSSTYVVAVTYRHTARNGDFWRSAPTVRSVVLGVGQNSITLDVVPCRWTARGEVLIEVWCSLSNQGFPLYLDREIVSDKTVDTQVFTITATDATRLGTGVTLDQFAPSNVLGHERVGATDFAVLALGRIWTPDPARPDILRYTIEHDISRDGFGWGWEATQILQLDTSVRPQALGELDGSLAVLAGNECHLVYGLGPDKQGAGLFGQPSKFGVVDLETSQARVARVPDSAVPGGLAYATPRGLYLLRRDRVSQQLSAQVERLFRFDGLVPQAVDYAPEFGEVWLMTKTTGQRSMRFALTTGRWCADSQRRAQDIAVSPRGVIAWLLADGRVRILDESLIADGADALLFRGETPTLRPDPTTVSKPYTLNRIFLHTHLISGPALLDISIVDARTGEEKPLLQQTYTVVGPESREVGPIRLPTFGHRIKYSQPAGDTGKIVIVQIDSDVTVSDSVSARTMTTL